MQFFVLKEILVDAIFINEISLVCFCKIYRMDNGQSNRKRKATLIKEFL